MKREPICPRCETPKKQLRSGILRCPNCTRKWNREYYHKSAQRREKQRRWTIERKYGISMDRVEILFQQQRESCAICRKHWTACEKSKHSRYDAVFLQYLYVDHCHASGKVRGLLCNKCNSAIAMFDERLERLDAAKNYLKRHAKE
ncbi:MAG TPA: endonuclease domain-containing protein [Candidatus Baltobacteraceae bacterium]